jgi:hypothetical protein
VKAAASGAHVDLDGATITAGTMSTVSGSSIDSIGGLSEISTGTILVNAGRLGAEGGDLIVTGPVKSTGTLDANGSLLDLAGSFSGSGKATIENGGTLEFGSAATAIATAVTFTNTGTGIETLKFDALATSSASLIYRGVISGFSASNDVIDFTGLTFIGTANPLHVALSGGNTVVTITEGADQVSFKLAGNHLADTFIVSQDGGTGTQIIDPPALTASGAVARPTSAQADGDHTGSQSGALGTMVAVGADHFIFANGSEANATTHNGVDAQEPVSDLAHGLGPQLVQDLYVTIAALPTFDPLHHLDGTLPQSWETQFHQIVQGAHSILH